MDQEVHFSQLLDHIGCRGSGYLHAVGDHRSGDPFVFRAAVLQFVYGLEIIFYGLADQSPPPPTVINNVSKYKAEERYLAMPLTFF